MTDEAVQPEDCDCEGTGCINCDPEHYGISSLKFAADGSATLGEVAGSLERYVAWLHEMERDGWVLEEDVDGGHLALYKPEKVAAG